MSPRVLLLNMPFVSVSRPAIGISILKAALKQDGIICDTGYPNLYLAEQIGLEAYTCIDEKITFSMFAGDWLFAQHLFAGKLDNDTFLNTLCHHVQDPAILEAFFNAMAAVGPFLNSCLGRFQIARFDIIGFTSTFQQTAASLALARLIKHTYPRKHIVFGGANCEDGMGVELHHSFPWIDVVCRAESEVTFRRVVDALADKGQLADIPGIVYRHNGATVANPGTERLPSMDAVPVPDYDDYFEHLRSSPLKDKLNPAISFETSRGCWWGQRAHCKFCGLNGANMRFRSKSPAKVLSELTFLKKRYGIPQFVAVDNIMDSRYFDELLPQLSQAQLGISLFYETRALLSREQVNRLRAAGVMAIQPGVESLNTHVLKLMRKGVTALHNIHLLRLCAELGVTPAWNLLYGFPGETAKDYAQMADLMEALLHLPPPHAVGPMRLDRFSPYFEDPQSNGLVNVRPFSMYCLIYPLPEAHLRNLAYFFEYDYANHRNPNQYMQAVLERIQVWQNTSAATLTQYVSNNHLILRDTRPNRVFSEAVLSGIQRNIYEYCEAPRHISKIRTYLERRYALYATYEQWLRQYLGQLCQWRVMVCDKDCYLSLALPASATTD